MYTENSTNASDVVNHLGEPSGLISDAQYWIALGFFMVLDAIAGLLGTVANILNVLVYSKMGFAESINISLTALAISDLGLALTTVGTVICFLLPTIPGAWFNYEIFLVPVAYPHVMLSKVSALITAYISLERYLCVLIPLKVKRFITPTRTLVTMVIIYAAIWLQFPTVVLKHPNGWKFDPTRNKTLLGVIPSTDPTVIFLENVHLMITTSIVPFSTFAIVLVCTILLIVSLQRSRAWRQASSSISTQTEGELESAKKKTKEARAIKMVITIAVVFIVAIVPSCVQQVIVMIVPDFAITGRYTRLYEITGIAYFGINALNGAANIVIYYKMSHKFRQTWNVLFKRQT